MDWDILIAYPLHSTIICADTMCVPRYEPHNVDQFQRSNVTGFYRSCTAPCFMSRDDLDHFTFFVRTQSEGYITEDHREDAENHRGMSTIFLPFPLGSVQLRFFFVQLCGIAS